MRLHTLPACYTSPDDEAEEIECTIHFTYSPGQPERGPTYACGGTPPEPAEVEVDRVDPSSPEIVAWAMKYMQGDGYYRACEQAADDMQPDPDDARDAGLDRRELVRRDGVG